LAIGFFHGSTVNLFPVLVVIIGPTIFSGLQYIHREIRHLNPD